MNSPKFGFTAIKNRYFKLTNKEIHFDLKNVLDLSEYLKEKYTINYIERQNGRLNNLAILNGFSGIQSEIEVINTNDASNRLELIFSIVQAEIQGNLKTKSLLSIRSQQANSKLKEYQDLYFEITKPQLAEMPFNYISEILFERLDNAFKDKPEKEYWTGFKSFIEQKYTRIQLRNKHAKFTSQIEQILCCKIEPSQILDIQNWYIDRNIEFINYNDLEQITEPYIETKSPQATSIQDNNSLSTIITHDKAEIIVNGIKTQYKNIKGKRLKLLLHSLQELNLLPSERIAKKFHNACNSEFDWHIATYTAMNDYKYNEEIDLDEVNGMKNYIQSLINT